MQLPIAAVREAGSEDDWRWQARNAVTDLETLASQLQLSEEERRGVEHAMALGFPMAITPYYLDLCDPHDPTCPLRRQCIPRIDETLTVPGDLRDPLGEEAHEVAPHLVQRYPDRALLLVTDHCALYCRFCTRSRMVGGGTGARSGRELGPALSWLSKHPRVEEVIISGGDPGLLSSRRIEALLGELAAIPHIGNVRFATRVPVVLPQRVTPDFVRALRAHPAVWVMTHFNHPRELTTEAKAACAALADGGVPVMNQTVLLRGVNDDATVLEQLFRGLVRTRVRPYYLLQADPVRGSGHFRTPLHQGPLLMEKLQGRVSGIALPRFVVDTPGGRGKVPVTPNYITQRQPGSTTLRTFRGEEVVYQDPPREPWAQTASGAQADAF